MEGVASTVFNLLLIGLQSAVRKKQTEKTIFKSVVVNLKSVGFCLRTL
jgi:hypothetical protein